jgi:peptide/nickel transport system permease protein
MRPGRWLLPAAAVALILALAIATPVLTLPDPIRMDVAHRLSPPDAAHWLGRDEYGRDVLARLLWGARISLAIALSATAIAAVVGTAMGVLGGYLRGVAELLTLRAIDVVLCFPPLLLALLVVTLAGPGAATLIAVLSVLFAPGFARVAYAGVLSARAQDYVEAVRVLGASPARIMWRTILPNVSGPVLVQASLTAAAALVLESGLSFLGLGVVPPAPSWGLMIRGARATMDQAPLLLLWPCLALTGTILAVNALCDAAQSVPGQRPGRARGRDARAAAPASVSEATGLLDVRGLTIEIDTPGGIIRPVRDVSLRVGAGETLAVVGESGSGKSLTALAILGLLPPAARAVGGAAFVDGVDTQRAAPGTLRRLRGGVAGIVFQDPSSSLNPVHRIGRQVAEAVRGPEARRRAIALLSRVGLPDPAARARAFPHTLSGGMRQRAMIAIAIANDPRVLIADEPTTALDVTIQAQVLDLLAALRREHGMALLFITHSLPVVAGIADRVAVMYAGQVVETGAVASVFARPLHPYTAALLASAPREDGTLPQPIPGAVPSPHDWPKGCGFAPRCAHRADACDAPPPLLTVGEDRATRCVRWRELFA